MISQDVISLPAAIRVLSVPVSEESALHRLPHLFQIEYHAPLGLFLFRIEHVVTIYEGISNYVLLKSVYGNQIPGIPFLARFKIDVVRLRQTVFPGDQKPSIRLGYQNLLCIRFRQTNHCCNSSQPRIQRRPITIILHVSSSSLCSIRGIFVDGYRQNPSSCSLLF